MGWLKDLGDQFQGKVFDFGLDMVGSKYDSDLRQREINEQAEYNADQNRQMFNQNVIENDRVFDRNRNYNNALFDRDAQRANEVFDKQKGYANEMWEREKVYNMDLWNKQNEYNDPNAQMQRLKDAGLNPNLMYGQGTTGNAATIHSSDAPAAVMGGTTGEGAPRLDPARAEAAHRGSADVGIARGGLNNYHAMRRADLMTQNMAMQNDLMREQLRGNKRENDLLDKTGFSAKDSMFARGAGRLWRGVTSHFDRVGKENDRDWKAFTEGASRIGGRAKRIFLNGSDQYRRGIADEDITIPMPWVIQKDKRR